MNGWILAIDCNSSNYQVARAKWEKYSISVDFVSSIEEATNQIYLQNYLLVIIVSDDLCYLQQLSSFCELTELPILVLSTTYNHAEKIATEKAGVTAYLGDMSLDTMPSCAWFLICQFNQKRKTETKLYITTYRNIFLCEQCFVVFINNQQLALAQKEFSLLAYLMNHAGLAMSYRQIYEYVWSQDDDGQGKRAVISLVNRLNQKLTNLSEQGKPIQSIWDIGYKIDTY